MSRDFNWYGTNRFLCDVLDDMLKCDKTKNYSMIESLVEEARMLGRRMETALADQKDLKRLSEDTAKARKKFKKLKAECEKLESQIEDLQPEELKKSD